MQNMKQIADWTVSENSQLSADFCLLKVHLENELPKIRPGQFVQIRVPNAPNTFLRRPISIHFVDYARHELWLLVQMVGEGTRKLSKMRVGESLNIIYPLGNGFTLPERNCHCGLDPQSPEKDPNVEQHNSVTHHRNAKQGIAGQARNDNGNDAGNGSLLPQTGGQFLLIGGGAGIAPLLYLGKQLCDLGYQPTFLLGGRTQYQLLQLSEFEKYGDVYTTTEDGSHGKKGFVTNHSIIQTYFNDIQSHKHKTQKHFNKTQMYNNPLTHPSPSTLHPTIYVCGPKPMMLAVAKLAKQNDVSCEVSLENRMACGIGACLCCVEKTTFGNACVCTAGPIFNINQLTWQL
ncbi:dihydroorotate dehydrogenase electron transfer subunit [Candidatus Symbiothrix dinenymphae]|uniref:dihydroorotate dehydrogenase electron transfer subunit n=1 Tax=Candidatus Symbiothrix dinenymphae TaxID=467085 RepID=UPI000703678D